MLTVVCFPIILLVVLFSRYCLGAQNMHYINTELNSISLMHTVETMNASVWNEEIVAYVNSNVGWSTKLTAAFS